MAVTLVVDAYNAIYAIPEAREELKKDLAAARKKITEISRRFARSGGYITDVRMVFDGDDRFRGAEFGPFRDKCQVFSRTGKGDDKVIETVREMSKRGRVILASNDNYVRNNARVHGASLMNAEDLLKAKTGKKKESAALDKNISESVKAAITREYRERLNL